MENENNAPTGENTAAEETVVDTQQEDTQSTPQEETTKEESKSVNQSLKIEEKVEEEAPATSQPTIDDIVEEALSGELSDETRQLIEDNNLGKHIDMLVAGHQAIQEKNDQQIFEVVGGKESYAELQEWGKNNMSKEEQSAFNEALFSGNMNLAKLAVQGLKAQYVSQNGKSPEKIIEGGGSVNESNRPFSSKQDYLKATQTQEYKHNPEYRKQVESKRNLSGF